MAVILLGSEPGRKKELELCSKKEWGIMELNNGIVTGRGTVLAFTGSYVTDGDKFTAFIATERHTPGYPSAFGIGIDDVNLTLTGKSTPTTACCTGVAEQAPGLAFEAVLVPMAD